MNEVFKQSTIDTKILSQMLAICHLCRMVKISLCHFSQVNWMIAITTCANLFSQMIAKMRTICYYSILILVDSLIIHIRCYDQLWTKQHFVSLQRRRSRHLLKMYLHLMSIKNTKVLQLRLSKDYHSGTNMTFCSNSKDRPYQLLLSVLLNLKGTVKNQLVKQEHKEISKE